MHLTRNIITYFDRPWEYLNDEQLAARDWFLGWCRGRREDMLRISEHKDGEKLLSGVEMRRLWKCFNELFFGGDLADGQFRWNPSLVDLGQAGSRNGRPTIEVNPQETAKDFGDYVALEFIGTLMHEAVHAFLNYYSCRFCFTWKYDLNASGHGRAFQILAAKLEEVFPRLLGLPLKLHRFLSLLANWDELKPLPSPHDLAVFGLESVRLSSNHNEDALRLLNLTSRQIGCLPEKYLEDTLGQDIETLVRDGLEHMPMPEQIYERREDSVIWEICGANKELATGEKESCEGRSSLESTLSDLKT